MQIAKNVGLPSSLIDFNLGREVELNAIWQKPSGVDEIKEPPIDTLAL